MAVIYTNIYKNGVQVGYEQKSTYKGPALTIVKDLQDLNDVPAYDGNNLKYLRLSDAGLPEWSALVADDNSKFNDIELQAKDNTIIKSNTTGTSADIKFYNKLTLQYIIRHDANGNRLQFIRTDNNGNPEITATLDIDGFSVDKQGTMGTSVTSRSYVDAAVKALTDVNTKQTKDITDSKVELIKRMEDFYLRKDGSHPESTLSLKSLTTAGTITANDKIISKGIDTTGNINITTGRIYVDGIEMKFSDVSRGELLEFQKIADADKKYAKLIDAAQKVTMQALTLNGHTVDVNGLGQLVIDSKIYSSGSGEGGSSGDAQFVAYTREDPADNKFGVMSAGNGIYMMDKRNANEFVDLVLKTPEIAWAGSTPDLQMTGFGIMQTTVGSALAPAFKYQNKEVGYIQGSPSVILNYRVPGIQLEQEAIITSGASRGMFVKGATFGTNYDGTVSQYGKDDGSARIYTKAAHFSLSQQFYNYGSRLEATANHITLGKPSNSLSPVAAGTQRAHIHGYSINIGNPEWRCSGLSETYNTGDSLQSVADNAKTRFKTTVDATLKAKEVNIGAESVYIEGKLYLDGQGKYHLGVNDKGQLVLNGAAITGGSGTQGPQGIQGVKGDTGAQGIQGPAGAQGPKGDKGDAGPQGIQGPAGKDGTMTFSDLTQAQKDTLKGAKGDTGPAGPQGIQGIQGFTGAQGIQGFTGPKGDTGAQGIQGPAGAQGQKGDKGDAGIQGPQGIQGVSANLADYTGAVKLNASANGGINLIGDTTITGNLIATKVSQTSDIRFKSNIKPIENALDAVMNLRGVNYTLDINHEYSAGVIAQEVESFIPEAVNTDQQGYKSVEYVALIPYLIESIKDLQEQIAILKAGKGV